MATRIFVKGLPPTIKEEDFRKHFSADGREVTDVKLYQRRQMGFVGYKTPEAAAAAVEYFHRTFIRLSKLSVELARPIFERSRRVDGPNEARNGPRTDMSREDPSQKTAKKRKRDDEELEDPNFREYLQTMQNPASKSWQQQEFEDVHVPVAVPAGAEGDSDGEYQELPARSKKRRTGTEETAQATKANEATEATKATGAADEALNAAPEAKYTTDEDFLRAHTSRTLDLLDDNELPQAVSSTKAVQNEDDTAMDEGEHSRTAKSEAQKEEGDKSDVDGQDSGGDPKLASIRKTSRLFVRNLCYSTSKDDISNLFSPFGQLQEVELPSASSGKNKGFALVQFRDAESAVEALQTLDKTEFQGRLIHIIPGEAKPEDVSRKQEETKRKLARISWFGGFNWNALVMSQDAVGASVALRLGVSKSELLDPTSSEGAVKQAVAETSVIEETKAYFASNGVHLDTFKSRERDASVILVKSLSYGTTRDELRSKFQEYGTVIRVLMPPSGTIAIVQFADAASGKSVMAKLNGKQFKGSHFMMSLGPKDAFARAPDPPTAPTGTSLGDAGTTAGGDGPTGASQLPVGAEMKIDGEPINGDEMEVEESSSLYVKNLHFSTTTDELASAFRNLDGFVSAKVMVKPDAKNAGNVLSMGFGFVQFRTKAQALGAAKSMDGQRLAGHELGVKLSQRKMDAAEEKRRTEAARKKANQRTKLIVKNLAFEATKKDVRSLLSNYGELRSVRIPRKHDHTSRGFAFAEFVSPQEAQNAHGALQHTHLLGRKLVIDYAEADTVDAEEELAKMQKKVAGQVSKVAMQRLTSRGRTKVNIGAADEGDLGDGDLGT